MIFDNLAHDQKAAIITEHNTFTYAEMLRQADSVAEYTAPRSVVFLFGENDYETICAYVGFLRKRVIMVLLSPNINSEQKKALIDCYKPFHIFTSQTVENAHPVYSLGEYTLFKTANTANTVHDELAMLITTSGSTGSHKFVRQSYANIRSNTDSIIEYLGITATDRPVTTLPFSYTYGLSVINTHLAVGAALALTNSTIIQKDFWEFMQKTRANSFSGVPYTYEILNKLRFWNMELPYLKKMTQAGGKLQKELVLKFAEISRQKNIEFYVMYGQTEATARMSYLPPEYNIKKAGSIGIAIPGGSFKIINEHGQSINETYATGELVYEGANVAMGYAENLGDLEKGDEFNGKLFTGDLAYRDGDGFYYISGRKKRFLKLYGNRVNLDEIDSLLARAGFNATCGGIDDLLKVYTEDSSQIDAIKNELNKNLGVNSRAYKIIAIDQIPRNASGKILYTELDAYV
jgi:acyl-CoA synthetase (AMP-forming)/AMP-acid ligase II